MTRQPALPCPPPTLTLTPTTDTHSVFEMDLSGCSLDMAAPSERVHVLLQLRCSRNLVHLILPVCVTKYVLRMSLSACLLLSF